MRPSRKTFDQKTYFIIRDADVSLYPTIHGLYYTEFEDGFAKAFPTDTPHIDQIYSHFERDIEALVLQAAGIHPVPWEKSLLEFLKIIEGHDFNWWLVGSASLAARGLPVHPHDIDLIVQDQGAPKMRDLMLDYLVEPLSDSRGWIWDWFGRAFFHARIEWVGDVNVKAEEGRNSDFGPTALARSETIHWHGHTLKVPPLDLQLLVAEQRGLHERAHLIRQVMSM